MQSIFSQLAIGDIPHRSQPVQWASIRSRQYGDLVSDPAVAPILALKAVFQPAGRASGSLAFGRGSGDFCLYPGDVISLVHECVEARPSRSKPDRGVVHSFIEVVNRHHEVVMSMKAVNFVLCKDGTA